MKKFRDIGEGDVQLGIDRMTEMANKVKKGKAKPSKFKEVKKSLAKRKLL